jgi:hypothetical protein
VCRTTTPISSSSSTEVFFLQAENINYFFPQQKSDSLGRLLITLANTKGKRNNFNQNDDPFDDTQQAAAEKSTFPSP